MNRSVSTTRATGMSGHPRRSLTAAMIAALSLAVVLGAGIGAGAATSGQKFNDETLRISAIPDQDPEKLNRLYGEVATYLSDEIGVDVEYIPVIDYTASVSSFRIGDLDAVWFGGLSGVQARLQTRGARPVAQRDIDAKFTSVFIANTGAGIDSIKNVAGLDALKGHTLTFGSEVSTSGRLMPQYFLDRAGIDLDDLSGMPGFSGSHDTTIELVEAGTFEAGALNAQVWEAAVAAGTVDPSKVQAIFTTPPYYDYHWLIRPRLDQRFGKGFAAAFTKAIRSLDASDPEQAAILELFGAERFIATRAGNYAKIEAIGRKAGLIT